MSKYRWMVINQSQSPMFQSMVGRLADRLGPCLLLTGAPHPNSFANLTVAVGPAYRRDSKRSRLQSWMQFSAFAAAQLVRYRDAHFVLTVTNPPMLPHIAWGLSRGRAMKTGVLVWDLYPEHIVQQGWAQSGGLIERGWRALNRRALAAADVVITIGDQLANAIAKQMNQSHAEIHVVPNWADTQWLKPIAKEKNPFAVEHQQVGKITVMYSGNLGGSHGTEILVAVARLLNTEPDIHFMIIGDGLGADAVDLAVNSGQMNNVTRLPFQPWTDIPQSLACGDIAIISQSRNSATLSVPSKTYSAMATGSAILALTDTRSDLAELVTANQIGAVCPPEDPEKIANTIRAWCREPTRIATMGTQARELSERVYSQEIAEETLHNLFRELV